MRYFFVLLLILFTSNICRSQDTSCNIGYIFCNAIDAVLKHVKDQSPNVYHDWTEVTEMKDSFFYHFTSRSYNYYLNAVVDTGNAYMRLSNYSAKRIFEFFLGKQITDSKSKRISECAFFKTDPCSPQWFLKPEFLFDSGSRFKMDSNYYETILIKRSRLYIFKKFGFQYFSLFRGKSDHGVSFYFFYKKQNGRWKLKSQQDQQSVNKGMQN
jgi:hypothetical protein